MIPYTLCITQRLWVIANQLYKSVHVFNLLWIWSLVLVWMLPNNSSDFCSSLIPLLKKYCNHFTGSNKSPSQHSLIIIHSTERNSYSCHIPYQHEEQTKSITLSRVTPALHVANLNRDYESEANLMWTSTFVLFQEPFIKFQSRPISSYRNNVPE